MSTALVILGCSQRKAAASRLLPAIERYDGPIFRVLRRHIREVPANSPDAFVLSAKYGLLPGNLPLPRYDCTLTKADQTGLSSGVDQRLRRVLADRNPVRIFVSVGRLYWKLIEGPLTSDDHRSRSLYVATGGIGGRASQLLHWLRSEGAQPDCATADSYPGHATLLGTTVQLCRAEALNIARSALTRDLTRARRFETWYVPVGDERVAPKWLASILFDKPVSTFRTADARRVLSQLGVHCIYATRQ